MGDKPNLLGGKGKRTYNNGVIARRYYEGEQPDGFLVTLKIFHLKRRFSMKKQVLSYLVLGSMLSFGIV